jgi:hypothetical protein
MLLRRQQQRAEGERAVMVTRALAREEAAMGGANRDEALEVGAPRSLDTLRVAVLVGVLAVCALFWWAVSLAVGLF